jgi:hypothetical protein
VNRDASYNCGTEARVNGDCNKVPQWIEGRSPTGPFVVRIDAEAVVPAADDSEPCFEPATMRLLERAQRLADAGDLESLSTLGEIYPRRSA